MRALARHLPTQPFHATEKMQASLYLEQQAVRRIETDSGSEPLSAGAQALEVLSCDEEGDAVRCTANHSSAGAVAAVAARPAIGRSKSPDRGAGACCGGGTVPSFKGSSRALRCRMASHLKGSSIVPRAPPRLFSSVTRAPAAAGSTATRKAAGEESRAACRGRNNTPRVAPCSAARCRRRICRGSALRSQASATSHAPERSVCSKAQSADLPPASLLLACTTSTRSSATPHPTSAGAKGCRGGATHAHQRASGRRVAAARRAAEATAPLPRSRSGGSRSGRRAASLPRANPHREPEIRWERPRSGGAAASPDGGMLEKAGEIPGHGWAGSFTSARGSSRGATRRPRCPR